MNKHKIIAIVMVPVLAAGGYIAAGYFANPEPPMRTFVADQGCKLAISQCVLVTPGLQLIVTISKPLQAGSTIPIMVETTAEINDVIISLADKNKQDAPVRLRKKAENKWQGDFFLGDLSDVKNLSLRMVVDWNNQVYFVDEKIIPQ